MTKSLVALGLWTTLVLGTISSAFAEDIFIDPWQLRAPNSPYGDLTAIVDDTIIFVWPDDENHTVYINPTRNCDDSGSILLGSTSPVEYTFTRSDLDVPAVFFADNIAQLCEWGMRFAVEVTEAPSASPTQSPSVSPTATPSQDPTGAPSSAPTTLAPTTSPTSSPTAAPTTQSPSESPTITPTTSPTPAPTNAESLNPTGTPSKGPTGVPTTDPTAGPTQDPTGAPTLAPTMAHSDGPTSTVTAEPSTGPTAQPTVASSAAPTASPTRSPTVAPSASPSAVVVPATDAPTGAPTAGPTASPTASPTATPTASPTASPTVKEEEEATPTASPTASPTADEPNLKPTVGGVGGGDRQVSTSLEGLRMGMAGITELPESSQADWKELTESFSTSYIFNDLKDKVSNYATTLTVTGVSPITVGRRKRHLRLRWADRRLQEEVEEGVEDGEEENKEPNGLIVEYTQTIEYDTVDKGLYTAEFLATAPFATEEDRNAYVALLKTSRDEVLADVKGVSDIKVSPNAPPTQAPIDGDGDGNNGDSNSNNNNNNGQDGPAMSKNAIIGIACGATGLLILFVLFGIYCRSGGGSENGGDDGKSSDEQPPLQVDVRDDDISTLAGPSGPPTYGDQSVATMDYDYSKAYGGAGDTSVSSAGGTFGSNTQISSLPNNSGATGAALGALGASTDILGTSTDDESYNARYNDPTMADGKEEIIHIFAPPGKLGVVIDTPDDGAPVVHAVKDTSVIADRIIVGDKLVAVDDEDVRSMTAIKVSKMISRKGGNPSRKLTVVRTIPIE